MISLARGIGRTVAESGSIQALRRHRGRTTSTAGESLIIQLLRSTFRTTIAPGMMNSNPSGTKGNWRGSGAAETLEIGKSGFQGGTDVQGGTLGRDQIIEKKNNVLLKEGKVQPGTKAYSQRAGKKA